VCDDSLVVFQQNIALPVQMISEHTAVCLIQRDLCLFVQLAFRCHWGAVRSE